MQVSELRMLFSALAKFISPAGAKAAGEFDQICDSLKSFDGFSLSELSSLLMAAEEYRRTGIIPSTVAKKKSPTPEASDELIGQLAKSLQDFDVVTKTPREIDEFVQKTIGKQSAPVKTAVAKQLGIQGKLTGPNAVKEIAGRLHRKLQMSGQANAS